MKLSHTHRAKMHRRRTITILLLTILLLTVVISSCNAIRRHSKNKAEEEARAAAAKKAASMSASDSAGTAKVNKLMSSMTLEHKILQMFIVTPEVLTEQNNVVAAGTVTERSIKKYPVGGIIYFAENLESVEQTEKMISSSQKYAKEACGVPLFISVDEEGGTVSRVAQKLGTTAFKPMGTYEALGAETAKKNAKTIAQDISAIGFNLDFAPDADVSTGNNEIIGERAYSSDYNTAAQLVSAAVEGFHEGGVLCTLKHFPGHGSTIEDSHDEIGHIYKDEDRLKTEDYQPFSSGIRAGADMVMTGHIIDEKLDSSGLPATFSKVMTVDILRNEMDFKGIIITDSLSMDSIKNAYTPGQAAVMAVESGHDMLLCPPSISEALEAIENAVASGKISRSQIDESVRRILVAKEEHGIL